MAVPTYQATGTFVESASANVSPAWPAHQSGDIGLLFVEHGTDNPGHHMELVVAAGFRPIPHGINLKTSTPLSAARSNLSVFWCRATSGAMGAPTLRFTSDHIRAVIITVRGCTATGNPWDVGANGYDDTDVTTVSAPGITTTKADCLVLIAVAHSLDTATSTGISGFTNASLATLTERVDSGSTIGHGSFLGIATGEKAVAGAVSATTATLAVASRHLTFVIALTGTVQAEDKTPYIKNLGRVVESAVGNITVPWPTFHEAGDVGLLVIEAGGFPISLTVDPDFIELNAQSSGTSGAVDATALSVWYKIALSSSEASPVVRFIADHVKAFIITVGGVSSSDPFNTINGASAGSGTAWSAPGGTTTAVSTLVLAFASDSTNNRTIQHHLSGFANANLTELHEVTQTRTDIGNGSGITVVSGKKAAAGAIGNTTGTFSAATRSCGISISLTGLLVDTLQALHSVFTLSGQSIGSKITTPLNHAAFTATGQDVTFLNTKEAFQAEPSTVVVTGQDVTFAEGVSDSQGRTMFWDKEEPPEAPTWKREL